MDWAIELITTLKFAAMTTVLGTILMGQFRARGPSDVTAPAISSVTASAGTYYFVGRTLTLTATFDEAVVVTGTPRIALTIGSNTRYATYASGTGTTTLTFSYTFVVGDSDTDGFAATSPIDLNGGAIEDAAGNSATLTFSAPSMTAKRAVLRGVTLATDFELTSVPDLLNKIDGTTISAAVGVQGSTINSDTNDPTWVAGEGSRYDGNDYFSDVPYEDGLANYIDTTTTWSIHERFKLPTGGSHAIWNSANFDGTVLGSWCLAYAGKIYFFNSNNVSAGSGDGGYRTTGIAVDAATAYYTVSLVCSAAGAGGIKVYVNGTQVGTITAATITAQSDPATWCRIGDAPNSYVTTSANVYTRAFAACNVAHSDDEVAQIHTYMAQLPNAA